MLLTFAHLSDIHVCDAQSPARTEYLDHWLAPDGPSYRPQEILTTHVADAMVQAVNAVAHGPVGGAPLQFAIATGDNIDNAQGNELEWYLRVMDGGEVRPDSGDLTRYEGVMDEDGELGTGERFWHPEGGRPDILRSDYGFPTVPGLLDAARAAFFAQGLSIPWLAVHGNHDKLLQGTVPPEALAEHSIGSVKAVAVPVAWSDEAAEEFVAGVDALDPAAIVRFSEMIFREVTPDKSRQPVTRAEFVAAHRHPEARPAGHGFGEDDRPYYRFDATEIVTLLVLDTVDEHGGWQGSLDEEQFSWLRRELEAADAERRYVVLASHHPLSTLINDITTEGAGRRVLGAELEAELARHPSVVLWVNGHTHMTAVLPHDPWWEITAPALVDWPQQGRIIELLRDAEAGVLTIAATMLDHGGELPWSGSISAPTALAGLSRELAANGWKWRESGIEHDPRLGGWDERNVLLAFPDPFTN